MRRVLLQCCLAFLVVWVSPASGAETAPSAQDEYRPKVDRTDVDLEIPRPDWYFVMTTGFHIANYGAMQAGLDSQGYPAANFRYDMEFDIFGVFLPVTDDASWIVGLTPRFGFSLGQNSGTFAGVAILDAGLIPEAYHFFGDMHQQGPYVDGGLGPVWSTGMYVSGNNYVTEFSEWGALAYAGGGYGLRSRLFPNYLVTFFGRGSLGLFPDYISYALTFGVGFVF